jgi:hypothetical protein
MWVRNGPKGYVYMRWYINTYCTVTLQRTVVRLLEFRTYKLFTFTYVPCTKCFSLNKSLVYETQTMKVLLVERTSDEENQETPVAKSRYRNGGKRWLIRHRHFFG